MTGDGANGLSGRAARGAGSPPGQRVDSPPGQPVGSPPGQPVDSPPGLAAPSPLGLVDHSPLGRPVDFTGADRPDRITLSGARVRVRPLDPERDAATLYALSHAPAGDPTIWTYLPVGPYPSLDSYRQALDAQAESEDPLFFVVTRARDDRPLGMISYLSIVPEHGRIELGHIWFSSELKRTPEATEAIFLLARHAFDELGNRRLEWKCNALNEPSRQAALRFGFEFEGIFADHMVVKGRNRDTAWFAMTTERWSVVRSAFERWLAPANFDDRGNQIKSLSELTTLRQSDSTF